MQNWKLVEKIRIHNVISQRSWEALRVTYWKGAHVALYLLVTPLEKNSAPTKLELAAKSLFLRLSFIA